MALREPRRFLAFLPLLVLAALLASGLFVCPAKVVFGIPCPGCGLTRATVAMASLQFGEMLRLHPFAPVLAPIFAWTLLRPAFVQMGWLSRRARDPLTRLPSAVWVALLLAVLGLWIARLLGALGGHPDPVDPTAGVLFQTLHWFGHPSI